MFNKKDLVRVLSYSEDPFYAVYPDKYDLVGKIFTIFEVVPPSKNEPTDVWSYGIKANNFYYYFKEEELELVFCF